jgi:DNA gyrase subunit A
MTDEFNVGTVLPKSLQEEMQTSYMEYAMSVIIARALPSALDGLKPVQRRILYAMQQEGATAGSRYRKCAAFVGEVMKTFHPHGDVAIYDALVRMAQPFSLRYPLIDGQGNFGSVDGDPPAAMRYTEARMSGITAELLADIEKNTVDFAPNYNGEDEEPTVLPARIPNLLINGSSGIAVGMTTNIPPHNLNEVAAAVKFLIDNPEATSEDLMGFVKGPDFPTGGIIKGVTGIKQAYATGHGRIIIRARHRFEEGANGRQRIVIEELPYQVNKANLVSKIAELVSDRKLEGISDLNDESDRNGMRIVIELKREARPYTVLNNLYKHTQLQQTFGAIMLALVDGRPVVLGLKQMLQVFIDHRRNVILRRTRFDLEKAQERAHILEGLKIALDHLDEVIATIRASKDPETASDQLQSKFGLSERQAKAILELRLQRLTQLERSKIDEEYEEVIKLIAYLESILASEQKVRLLIQEEMDDLVKKYGDERRTEIDVAEATELSAEDLIPKEEVVVTLTHRGYVKRQPSRVFRAQRRGGVGLKGARPTAGGEAPTGTREEDFAEHLLITNSHAQILYFTQSGRVFLLHAYEIPERERQAKGTPINNLLDLAPGERITAVFVRPEADDGAHYMVMATRRGQIKKTAMREYANVRRNGLIAINLQKGDELEYVRPSSGDDEILIASEKGKAVRFHESEVRPMGRDTMGVRGMKLGADDLVAGMVVVQPQAQLLVLTQRGFGKRTALDEYPTHHRGGQGVFTLQVTDKVGRLAAIRVVENPAEEEILVITASGMVLRTVVEAIRQTGRQTQGVIVMRLQPDDQIVGVAPVGVGVEDEVEA